MDTLQEVIGRSQKFHCELKCEFYAYWRDPKKGDLNASDTTYALGFYKNQQNQVLSL